MTTNKQIVEKIKKAKNIAIFAHVEPDADACGSMFGMRGFCRLLGKNAEVFCASYDEYVANLFPMNETRKDFQSKDFDLVVFLDMHVETRLANCFVEEFRKCKNVVVIDHHILDEHEVLPTKNFRIIYKASASQLVLDLFREIKKMPDEQTATYLFSGLVGDTDRFMFLAGFEDVFDDAKDLLKCGADYVQVYNKMYRMISKKEIELTKYLYNNMIYLRDGKVALAVFSTKTMKKYGATTSDVKAFSNSLLNIKGVKWSLLAYQIDPNRFRVSMRSAQEIDLVPLAVKMGGGGHRNASAFTVTIKENQIKRQAEKWADEVLNG